MGFSVFALVTVSGCASDPPFQAAEWDLDAFRVAGEEACDGIDNTGDGVVDEGCTPCEMVPTRTVEFWADAACVIEGAATGESLLPLSVALHTFSDTDDLGRLLGRDPVIPRRWTIAQEIAAAKLNIAAFGIGGSRWVDIDADGEAETLDEVVAWAEAAYPIPPAAYQARRLLNRINASGVAVDTWFDPSCVAPIEICNLVDDDLDGSVDEGCLCVDEICDGVDNDFNGIVDDGCPCEPETPDVCWTFAEGLSRGELVVSNSADGVAVYVTNTGESPICLDGYLMASSVGTQAFVWGNDVAGAGVTLAPGEKATLYYGSWTTDNGIYSIYEGELAWWCVENAQYAAGGAVFEVHGELPPDDVLAIVNEEQDYDEDGIEDHVDWQDVFGVATNYHIWDYQAESAALTAGKSAIANADGTIAVDLIVRNMGALAGSGVLTDTVPAGWTVVDDGGATLSVEPDGTSVLRWDVCVEGYADGGLTFDSAVLAYAIARDVAQDAPRVDLPAATIAYFDGMDEEVSRSHATVAWGYDADLDGVVSCEP